jgi:hypothetical protein
MIGPFYMANAYGKDVANKRSHDGWSALGTVSSAVDDSHTRGVGRAGHGDRDALQQAPGLRAPAARQTSDTGRRKHLTLRLSYCPEATP